MNDKIYYRKVFWIETPRLWHFNPRCPYYPTEDFVEITDAPPVEDLCHVCAAPDRTRTERKPLWVRLF